MRVLISVLLVVGCDREHVEADSREETCVGTALVQLCTSISSNEIELRDRLDTDSDPRFRSFGAVVGVDDACVIAGRHVEVISSLRVVGSVPLILVGDRIVFSASVDVSSDRLGEGGAGARWCASYPPVFTGGSPGATYQFVGGEGGNTDIAPTTPPNPVVPLRMLGGGCGTPHYNQGAEGGGALYAIASTSITVTATSGIDASGAGGDGGACRVGGMGGGSGGLIGFDAPRITIDGNVIAKGGGGGGGGSRCIRVGSIRGGPGEEASLDAPMAVVPGGPGVDGGGSGGDGANGTTGGSPRPGTIGGGGGGGGGAGYILVYGELVGSATFNPSPTR